MTDEPMEMSEADRIAQRFVDQELSAQERIALLTRLGRDEALRAELLSLERLAFDAARLPRPVVPAGFVDTVLQRTASEPARHERARTHPVLAPRVLRWNLAVAMGLAAAILLVIAGAIAIGRSWQSANLPAQASAPQLAPDSPTTLVRLIVMQPDAKAVAVAGDFNGWNPSQTPLERVSGDAWAVTIALRPGRYEYMFVIDGNRWVADPFAAERHDDGFGSQNAVLDVRPKVTPL